jgi:hypothetical protein
MTNIELMVDEHDLLHITIDLKKTAGYTKRGNVLLATTHGNANLPGPGCTLRGERLNLSLWRNPTPTERATGEVKIVGWQEKEGQQ